MSMVPKLRSRTAGILTLVWLALFAPGLPGQTSTVAEFQQIPLNIVAVVVTPHVWSEEIKYRTNHVQPPGALVRLIIQHRETAGAAIQFELKFNGRLPSEINAAGEWTWYAMPENLGKQALPLIMSPGEFKAFTFNGKGAAWSAGATVQLSCIDRLTGTSETLAIPLTTHSLKLASIVGLPPTPSAFIPDRLLVHLANDGSTTARLTGLRIYTPSSGRLYPAPSNAPLTYYTTNGQIPPNDRACALAMTGNLPATFGLVEAQVTTDGVNALRLFASLRFKRDRFDIGAGWIAYPLANGIVPVKVESYLKTLMRMHVNLAHIPELPGYTDATGPDGLYTRYPLRLMDWYVPPAYNSDEWVSRIHAADRVGEPETGGETPMMVWNTIHAYDEARYPSCISLTVDRGYREFAGLSDFPHFDAYRVVAPHADDWSKYTTRWAEGTIRWGAPLEGVGVMMRTLREVSRPWPVAFWSQSSDSGWGHPGGRLRASPTPDEILLQAWQGIANGAKSLYWYSLGGKSLIDYRDVIDITTRIGRQLRALDDYLVQGDAYWFQRNTQAGRPDMDLNAIAAPRVALLFAMDLEYYPDMNDKVFRFRGPRHLQASFPLPGWMRNPRDVFRINDDGVQNVTWTTTLDGVEITDDFNKTAVYGVALDTQTRDTFATRLGQLRSDEMALNFDPAENYADFMQLANDLQLPVPKKKH